MHRAKLIAAIVLLAAVATIVFQNRSPVPMRILWIPAEMPLSILVGIGTLMGYMMGMLTAVIIMGRRRRKG